MPMAAGPDSVNQRIAIDAGNRRFAGGIDIGDDNGIGVVEAGAER